MDLPQHPDVNHDVAQVSKTDPDLAMRLQRLMAFVEHVEQLSHKKDYRRLWPDRLPDVGELPLTGAELATSGPVKIYTWEREGFVVSLEERWVGLRPRFRWLTCVPGGNADAVVALAKQRAATHWDHAKR